MSPGDFNFEFRMFDWFGIDDFQKAAFLACFAAPPSAG